MKDSSEGTLDSLNGLTTLDDRLDSLVKFGCSDHNTIFLDVDLAARKARLDAIYQVCRLVVPSKQERLSVIDFDDAVTRMDLGTSAGYHWPGLKRKDVVTDALNIATKLYEKLANDGNTSQPPCKLALRVHQTSVQPVWVYPFEVSLLEAKWAIPLYEWLGESVPSLHCGRDAVPRLSEHKEMPGYSSIILEWDSLEATVGCSLIDDAFKIIFQCFGEEVYIDGVKVELSPEVRSNNIKLRRYLVHYFKETHLMLPDGVVVHKIHGVPIGSSFAQAVTSIINMIVIRFLSSMLGFEAEDLKVWGDKGTFFILGKHLSLLPAMSGLSKKFFGLVLKAVRDVVSCID